MKIGVISDIHSNVVALDACLSFMESRGCEEYLFLGDYISDTPYTRETMDRLYEFFDTHECMIIRGNREEYMIEQRRLIQSGAESGIWIKGSSSGNLLYTYEQLDDRDIDFFESLKRSDVYRKEGYPAITIAHGSPDNCRQLLQHESSELKQVLDRIDTGYLLCAHTHFPGITKYNGKTYYNSGCVGVAIGTPGLAQCLILNGNSKEWIPEFHMIPYDNRRVASECMSSGLWDYARWFINSNIQILLTGVDNAARLVERAIELDAGDNESEKKQVKWPYIEEKYFEAAASEIGVPDYEGYVF